MKISFFWNLVKISILHTLGMLRLLTSLASLICLATTLLANPTSPPWTLLFVGSWNYRGGGGKEGEKLFFKIIYLTVIYDDTVLWRGGGWVEHHLINILSMIIFKFIIFIFYLDHPPVGLSVEFAIHVYSIIKDWQFFCHNQYFCNNNCLWPITILHWQTMNWLQSLKSESNREHFSDPNKLRWIEVWGAVCPSIKMTI